MVVPIAVILSLLRGDPPSKTNLTSGKPSLRQPQRPRSRAGCNHHPRVRIANLQGNPLLWLLPPLPRLQPLPRLKPQPPRLSTTHSLWRLRPPMSRRTRGTRSSSILLRGLNLGTKTGTRARLLRRATLLSRRPRSPPNPFYSTSPLPCSRKLRLLISTRRPRTHLSRSGEPNTGRAPCLIRIPHRDPVSQ